MWNWIRKMSVIFFYKKVSFKVELGGQKGELSRCTIPHSPLQTKQKETDPHCQGEGACFTIPAEEERFFSQPSNSLANERLSHTTQPMKSHYTSDSRFTPMDFLFTTAPPTSPTPLFSMKEPTSPLCFGLVCGFAVACVAWIVILCCSRINQFFW